jgi:hypothetical protein
MQTRKSRAYRGIGVETARGGNHIDGGCGIGKGGRKEEMAIVLASDVGGVWWPRDKVRPSEDVYRGWASVNVGNWRFLNCSVVAGETQDMTWCRHR